MITLVFLGFLGFFAYSFYSEFYKRSETKINVMNAYVNLQYAKKYRPSQYRELTHFKVD